MKDYFDYKEKICVVTGAASGMGKATSQMLIELGAVVYAIDYSKAELPGVEKFIRCDLAQKIEIDRAFEELPQRIDCFFGEAGISGQHHDYNTVVIVNFIANKYIIEEYLSKRMKENGAIAFVSSLAAVWWENHVNETQPFIETATWEAAVQAVEALNMNDQPGTEAYFLSKRLVNHLVCATVPAFAKKNIRVNCIMPGATKTGLTQDFADMMGGEENLVTGFANRPAIAEEMAAPIVFLNSSMASYINGICMVIDAGESSTQMINKELRAYDFDLFTKK